MANETVMRIRLEGTEKAIAGSEARRRAVLAAISKAMEATGIAAVGGIKMAFGGPGMLKRRTGALSRAVVYEKEDLETGTRVRVGVLALVPYGPIHEYGGTILPKRGPFLRFKTEDGQWHSVRSVVMPARPYLRPGVMAQAEGMRERLQTAIAAALKGGA